MIATIEIIFDIYIFMLLLRLLMQLVQADYFNPICKFIFQTTQPLIKITQKIIPPIKHFDSSIIILLLITTIVKLYITSTLLTGILPNVFGIAVWSAGELSSFLINFLFYLVIIRAILSWVQFHQHNSYTVLLIQLTEPLLIAARNKIPPLGGMDFSPIIILLLLKLVEFLISSPLIQFGTRLALM